MPVTCPDCGMSMPWDALADHLKRGCKGSAASRHKYGVAVASKRRHFGVTYHSRAEMLWAMQLDVHRNEGSVIEWFRQARRPIGTEEIVSDFVVIGYMGRVHGFGPSGITGWVVEIKGVETSDWRRHKRWWREHGKIPLVILKRTRDGWERELVEAAR